MDRGIDTSELHHNILDSQILRRIIGFRVRAGKLSRRRDLHLEPMTRRPISEVI